MWFPETRNFFGNGLWFNCVPAELREREAKGLVKALGKRSSGIFDFNYLGWESLSKNWVVWPIHGKSWKFGKGLVGLGNKVEVLGKIRITGKTNFLGLLEDFRRIISEFSPIALNGCGTRLTSKQSFVPRFWTFQEAKSLFFIPSLFSAHFFLRVTYQKGPLDTHGGTPLFRMPQEGLHIFASWIGGPLLLLSKKILPPKTSFCCPGHFFLFSTKGE